MRFFCWNLSIASFAACPVNLEFLNYTIITSQCKGPLYPPSLCCGALTAFACPYADDLNDLTNDCASTMFSYINLNGNYPPGLFASECKDGKQGLACNGTSSSAPASGSQIISIPPPLLVLLSTGFLVLLLLFLWRLVRNLMFECFCTFLTLLKLSSSRRWFVSIHIC